VEWPIPKSREVALFTDLTLYMEALELAVSQNSITVTSLQGELGQRLQKLRLVPQQSPRTVERLMRELRIFNWVLPQSQEKTSITTAPHIITNEGKEVLDIARNQPHKFLRRLIIKMQDIYVIPGWLIARLWQINPKGQGEVILPAPSSDWKPSTRAWNDNEWTNILQEQTLLAAKSAHRVSANAFPIKEKDWLLTVQSAWVRLSTLKPRQPHEKEGVV
jgi:hypothetical protein